MSAPQILKIIKNNGGTIHMSEALDIGINRYTLYSMLDKGEIERLSRGVYRASYTPAMTEPDLAIVASRIPKAVICLISALSYHDLTTQIPHRVSIALPTGVKTPKLDYPPISAYRFNKESFEAGIETHQIDGVSMRVYNPEKTLVDCFKFRNKIGMKIVLEAFRNNINSEAIPVSFKEVISQIRSFIQPIVESTINEDDYNKSWLPESGWC